jgi:predicted nucleic acid-binding protein
MVPLAKLKPLALDSNLPLDLAAGLDAAHTFREVFLERGYRLFVPPTVVTELTLLAEEEANVKNAALALRALQSLREWDIEPYDLKSVGHGITEEFARRLMAHELLPDEEFNDGVILAETSLAKIPVLVTSDHHLLDISPEELQPEFVAADLAPVTIAHPKALLRALR